jgi:hypothetical protein
VKTVGLPMFASPLQVPVLENIRLASASKAEGKEAPEIQLVSRPNQ